MKRNESERMKKANNIRKIEHKEMTQHEPYAAAVMIREQGKQIEHLSPMEYLQKKGIGK